MESKYDKKQGIDGIATLTNDPIAILFSGFLGKKTIRPERVLDAVFPRRGLQNMKTMWKI